MAASKKAVTDNTPENTEEVDINEQEKVATKKKVAEEAPEEKQKFVAKDIDPNQYIVVKNGFQGKLVYISSRTHEKFVWDEFGDEQELELRELKNAKGSAKKFFENNWFLFDKDDAWVIDYLGLSKQYKYALNLDDFDDLFQKDPKEIASIISKLSKGQKRSVAYRARKLIQDEVIDSNRIISTLEKSLGVELVER